jgi:hypothetical protein
LIVAGEDQTKGEAEEGSKLAQCSERNGLIVGLRWCFL